MSPLPAVHVDDWNFIQIQKVLKKDEKGRSSEPTLNPQTCWYVLFPLQGHKGSIAWLDDCLKFGVNEHMYV